MPRAKKIEQEIEEAKTKIEEISKEIDVNEVNKEADNISDIIIKVFDKEYKISELIEIADKQNKTYEEAEISKKFKLLMRNYYDGIINALLRPCCGKKYTIDDLKRKLKEKDSYNIIDIRCSRNNIRFDKDTIDKVIIIAEKYKFDR